MFWYYKYPLIVIVIALVIGCGVLVWRSCIPENKPVIAVENVDTNENAVVDLPPLPPANAGDVNIPRPASADEIKVAPQNVSDTLRKAEEALANDNPKLARELAYSVLTEENCEEYDQTWMAIANVIDKANKVFMNSKAPCPEKQNYTIVAGDALVRIAYNNNTSVEAFQRLNSLKSTSSVIVPGQVLTYIAGNWSIKVSKSHFLLSLYLDDKLYRIYNVCVGRQDRTPVGTFIINQKQMNPSWTSNGEVIPFGDERNVLGTRWLGLEASGDTDSGLKGYGIHGTTEPDTIGTAASDGCVRMRNEEVEELFDFIPASYGKLAIPVVITE